jgi:hypothetical protein
MLVCNLKRDNQEKKPTNSLINLVYSKWASININLMTNNNNIFHKLTHPECIWDLTDSFLVLAYSALLLWSLTMLKYNWKAFNAGQANGLIWYLGSIINLYFYWDNVLAFEGCTLFLCFCRSVGFFMVPFAGDSCTLRFKYWQW